MFELQNSYADASENDNFWNDFLSKPQHYDMIGCMIHDIDEEEEQCNKESSIYFDFSIQNGSIGYQYKFEGSITINDTKYENIHGNIIISAHGGESMFLIYDSNNNNVLNFATDERHQFFNQLSDEDASELSTVIHSP